MKRAMVRSCVLLQRYSSCVEKTPRLDLQHSTQKLCEPMRKVFGEMPQYCCKANKEVVDERIR